MAENKKSFIAYIDWKDTFNALPDDKAGKLIKHLLAYVNDEHPESKDVLINAVFANIKQTLKRDLKKYESIIEKRSKAGKASAAKKQHMLTHVNTLQHTSTHSTDNDNDNDNVINNIYTLYPSKCFVSGRSTGKCAKDKKKIATLLKQGKDVAKIIEQYLNDCKNTKTYLKNFGTFLNNLPDYSESTKVTEKKIYATYDDIIKPGWER
jgi:hypothetical protein